LAASNTARAVLNFYAGPTVLPSPVIARLQEDILDFHDTGMGVMEISHRTPEIEGLIADTAARVRWLLGLSAEFEVLPSGRRAGHRSAGGCRASLLNGVTQGMVDRLVEFMRDFEQRSLTGREVFDA
jgi:phosphoserine aminotransferase